MNVIVGSFVAMVVSAVAASVTVVSLVGAQTDGPEDSPGNAGDTSLVEYGTTDG